MPAPTIILVHGAFADASGWQGVHDELRSDGHVAKAPPNPLRGVVGGAVITVAGVADNVVGLVYVAGFAPASRATWHRPWPSSCPTSSAPCPAPRSASPPAPARRW
ncbi:esterase/lipase [Baekduia alba]|uniref:hypothetical protein n=1 Tax=Baekduia alba TaxID=2997333 RepID=UPI002340ABDC|nr:hypothetical protein [Baekduia alba]WCB95802.1 esterase/lipase [Baekduia alba]